MTTIGLSEGQTHYFTPQDFGFPAGATLQEYKNYYIKFYDNVFGSPNEGYDALFVYDEEVWQYNHYPTIWFGDIIHYGLRANSSPIVGATYRLKYKILRSSFDQILINSLERGPASAYPSVINVDIATAAPSFVPSNISVEISNFSHSWTSDLYVVLRSPAGAAVVLFCNNLGSNSYLQETFSFKDGGSNINDKLPGETLDGPFRVRTLTELNSFFLSIEELNDTLGVSFVDMFESINSLLQDAPDGDWVLYIYDNYGGDGGIIEDWSITFIDDNSDELTYTTEKNLPISESDFLYLNYYVANVNSPPENFLLVPGTPEERVCPVGRELSLELYIYDEEADSSSSPVDVSVTVSAGTLSLQALNSSYISGNNTNQLLLHGTIGGSSFPDSISWILSRYNFSFTSPIPAPPIITLTVTTNDNDVNGIGGPKSTTNQYQITTIYPQPPIGIPFKAYLLGGGSIQINYKSFQINDTRTDGYLSNILAIIVNTLPEAGTIKLGGIEIALGQYITIAEIQDSELVYENLAGVPEDTIFTFGYFVVSDVDSVTLGGVNVAEAPTFSMIHCYSYYTPPSVPPIFKNTDEGKAITLSSIDFGYEELQDFIYEFGSYEFLSLPSSGKIVSGLEDGLTNTIYSTSGTSIAYLPPENVLSSFSESFTVRLYSNEERITLSVTTGQAGPRADFYWNGSQQTTSLFPSEIVVNTNLSSMSNLTIDVMGIKYDGIYDTTGYIRSPNGEGCVLFYQNIYNNLYNPTDYSDITFDDKAANFLPTFANVYTSLTPSGAYKPSPKSLSESSLINWPGGPVSTTLSVFNDSAPAGVWQLDVDIVNSIFSVLPEGSISSWGMNFKANRPGMNFVDVECHVFVEPKDNRPRIVSTTVIECLEGTEIAISGITLFDPDGFPPTVSVKIECLDGISKILLPGQATLTGNNTSSLTVSGNYQDIKDALELPGNLLYISDQGFTGNSTIKFTVTSPAPNDPLLISTRITNVLVIARISKIVNTPLLSPSVISHDKAIDTAIAIYWNDPRTNGSFWLGGELVPAGPKQVPDFEGQLISFLTYQENAYQVFLLCGHDAGSGLQWYEVRTNGNAPNTSIDARTGTAWDPYWRTNCNPPWICD